MVFVDQTLPIKTWDLSIRPDNSNMSKYTWSTRYCCIVASFMTRHLSCTWYEKQPDNCSNNIEHFEGRDNAVVEGCRSTP